MHMFRVMYASARAINILFYVEVMMFLNFGSISLCRRNCIHQIKILTQMCTRNGHNVH